MSTRVKLEEGVFLSLADVSGAVIIITDANAVIQYVNQRFTEVTGYSQVEALGLTPSILNSGKTPEAHHRNLWQTIKSGQTWRGRILNRKKNGEYYWSMQSIASLRGEDDSIINYISISEDVTNIGVNALEDKNTLHLDPVTQLGNKNLCLKDLQGMLGQRVLNRSQARFYLIEIDGFGQLVSKRGVNGVDIVIRQVAERINSLVLNLGSVYRFDVSTFAVLSLDDSGGDCYGNLQRLADEDIALEYDALTLVFNIGVVSLDVNDASEVVRRAELSVSRSRQRLGTTTTVYDAHLIDVVTTDNQLFSDLKLALSMRDVYLVGQPIYDSDSGKLMKVELLLRWKHLVYGFVSPLKVIELAERFGYLNKVAVYVVERLTEFLALQGANSEGVSFAINLNVVQIMSRPLLVEVLELFQLCGVKRENIILEMTETGQLNVSNKKVIDHLRWIRKQGVKIAIDDFGSGYSTIDYLNAIEVDVVKIDRSLVSGIESSQRRWLTLKTILNLCYQLGVSIVVEGVETEDQHLGLMRMGVKGLFLQGFYYGRPVPLSEDLFKRRISTLVNKAAI